jgi:hypothetical protein
MAKWGIPEGRKPLTDADIAALTRRLAGTAVDYKELYEAAKRDAEEAEAYAAELEVKLAKAVEAAFYEGFCEGRDGGWVWGDPTPAWKKSDALAELNTKP